MLSADRTVAARNHDDILLVVIRPIGRRRPLTAGRQPGFRQLSAVRHVIGAQVVVDGGAPRKAPPPPLVIIGPRIPGTAHLEGQGQRRHVVHRAVLVHIGDAAGAEIYAGDITPRRRLAGNLQRPNILGTTGTKQEYWLVPNGEWR